MSTAGSAAMQQLALGLRQRFSGMSERDAATMARALIGEEPYVAAPESQACAGVPTGCLQAMTFPAGSIYPGCAHEGRLYLPAQSDGRTPIGLMIFLDGARYLAPEIAVPAVFDNLIAAGELPPLAALFLNPGSAGPGLPLWGSGDNRSLEYDAPGDIFSRFLIEEILPVVEQQHPLIDDPAWRGICGFSSGGMGALNAAWERPDAFGKVLTHCGSFVDIRGGDQMPARIRRDGYKPLRVLLQTGSGDLDVVFGNWPLANQQVAAALAYVGCECRLEIGSGGHSLRHGGAIFPESMRWLWRG